MVAATAPELAILTVRHEGRVKMVGKLFHMKHPAPDGTTVAFLHCHESNQRHYHTNCPSPLDATVARWLRDHGVTWVYCYERDTRIMRKALVADILAAPAIKQGGRERHCLAEGEWRALSPVLERAGARGARGYYHAKAGLVLAVPFLRREVSAEVGL